MRHRSHSSLLRRVFFSFSLIYLATVRLAFMANLSVLALQRLCARAGTLGNAVSLLEDVHVCISGDAKSRNILTRAGMTGRRRGVRRDILLERRTSKRAYFRSESTDGERSRLHVRFVINGR